MGVHTGPVPRSAAHLRLTLLAACFAQGMILLDVTIVNVALPSIQQELHISAGNLEWVISAYSLALAALIPIGGAIGDRYGRKRFFVLGLVIFTVAPGSDEHLQDQQAIRDEAESWLTSLDAKVHGVNVRKAD